MHHLQIEHPISDFDTWKEAFDSFADFRQRSGVRRYRVLQPTDDPNYIIIELEFDGQSEAEAFPPRCSATCGHRGRRRQPCAASRRHASSRRWR